VITLYQAEWCPYSSAVRQRLTELGVDFIARQVEPDEAQRSEVNEIPTLEAEDGTRHEGTDAVFAYLAGLGPGRYEREHRQKLADHPDRHRTTTIVLRRKAPLE
jgi:glutathione S-transferase